MILGWILVLIIILIMVMNIIFGYKKGLIHQLSLLVSLIVTIILMQYIIYPILINFGHTIFYSVISFVIVLFLVKHLFKKLKFINNIALIGFVNKLLGMVVGEIKALILVVLLMLVVTSPMIDQGYMAVHNNTVLSSLDNDFRIAFPFYNQLETVFDMHHQNEEGEMYEEL